MRGSFVHLSARETSKFVAVGWRLVPSYSLIYTSVFNFSSAVVQDSLQRTTKFLDAADSKSPVSISLLGLLLWRKKERKKDR